LWVTEPTAKPTRPAKAAFVVPTPGGALAGLAGTF
jgi:hypothetical protein